MEGELTLTRTLIVETAGVVKANVAVRNAIVSGVVVGNINATESVELTREGRMVGDIHAPRVIIVDGASFRGRVDMGEVEPGRCRTAPRPQAARRGRPAPAARPGLSASSARPAPPAPPTRVRGPAAGRPFPPPRPPNRPPPPPPAGAQRAQGGSRAAPVAAAWWARAPRRRSSVKKKER